MTKKITIAGAFPYNGNRGVGALSISTLFLLNKIAQEYNIKLDIALINTEYGNKQKDKIYLGDNTWIDVTNIDPIKRLKTSSLIKTLLTPKGRYALKRYRETDYFLNMGAGDSFSDIYGIQRFDVVNEQNRIASFFRKKLLLLPQTIGPFKNIKVKNKAIKSIESAKVVFPRDKQSYTYVSENSRQETNIEVIDVAFFMPFERKSFDKKYIHFGLNVSSLLWNGGYTKDNQFNLKSDYKKLVKAIINEFVSYDNVKIHLIPHVVTSFEHIENDYKTSLDIVEEYNHPNIVSAPFFLSPLHAKNYISGLNFFCGARMHSTIAAFSSGVPVYPMAYSRKFNGLFEDTLDYKYMGDMVNKDADKILSEIRNAFQKREYIKDIIENRLNTIIEERGELLKKHLTSFLDLK